MPHGPLLLNMILVSNVMFCPALMVMTSEHVCELQEVKAALPVCVCVCVCVGGGGVNNSSLLQCMSLCNESLYFYCETVILFRVYKVTHVKTQLLYKALSSKWILRHA